MSHSTMEGAGTGRRRSSAGSPGPDAGRAAPSLLHDLVCLALANAVVVACVYALATLA